MSVQENKIPLTLTCAVHYVCKKKKIVSRPAQYQR